MPHVKCDSADTSVPFFESDVTVVLEFAGAPSNVVVPAFGVVVKSRV